MNAEKAAEELKVIRQLMERPVRYSTMSGLSAVLAGCAALAGLVLDRHFSARHEPKVALWLNGCVWAGVFLVALAATLILTRVREKARGMPFWSPVKRRILATVLPPFIASVGLTLAVVWRLWSRGGWECVYQGYLIPAVWMLFYGVALCQLGQFSPIEVKLLGVCFIAAGLLTAALYQWYPYWAMGVTFGGFHVVYGVVVWIRHGG